VLPAPEPEHGARDDLDHDPWNVDLGGPAPGVPPRKRPYVAYTNLLDDRAEEIAEAEARKHGKRAVSSIFAHKAELTD
jgi:hypothetical protein